MCLAGGVAVAAGTILAAPVPAWAAVYYGFGFGVPWIAPPIVVRPPVYYPPPVYYAPPPTFYAPPGYVAPGAAAPRPPGYAQSGQSCLAAAYRCPMDRPTTPGAACYCPGNDGQRVWGHAN